MIFHLALLKNRTIHKNMKHEKKVWPEYFQKIVEGKKTYELRLANWECQEGDILVLQEWDPVTKEFTGRVIEKEVTYVGKTKDMNFWLEQDVAKYGYQIISFTDYKNDEVAENSRHSYTEYNPQKGLKRGLIVGIILTICNFIPYLNIIPKVIANSISWGWKAIIISILPGSSYRPLNFFGSDWEFLTLLPLSVLIGVLLYGNKKWQKNIGVTLVIIFSLLVIVRTILGILYAMAS